jgi:hypothetical protein
MVPVVTIEEARGGKSFARFLELPFALHHTAPQWAPPITAYEKARLDPPRNPFFETGDAVYLLARRVGKPAGRMSAHIAAEGGEGWFGFYDTVDDPTVVRGLVDAARAWLTERGCTSMTGPASFTLDDESGVQVSGHEVPGVTGRQWHPDWYAPLLLDAGFESLADRPSWRLSTIDDIVPTAEGEVPPHAGAYGDPRIVLRGIAAVPDIAEALRSTSPRSAWSLAKRAKAREWKGCTVVRCDGDASLLVPRLQAAAGAAGYEWVIAPWCNDPTEPPETVHRVYHLRW